jgi:hypothetical protein
MDLWKQAYRAQFESDPDEDMAEYADDVEAWRISWQGGYDAGEEWATALVGGAEVEDDAEEEAEVDDEEEAVAAVE